MLDSRPDRGRQLAKARDRVAGMPLNLRDVEAQRTAELQERSARCALGPSLGELIHHRARAQEVGKTGGTEPFIAWQTLAHG